jgi:oxygen-independent coproporphyrinogen III oxidase
LGRVHSRSMVFKSFDILRQAGFNNLNVDLMFAIPGQSLQTWRETLSEATALGSEHLSSYEVIYEEDTALYSQLKAGEFDINEDLACEMYEELVHHAGAAGLVQYEVANFARGPVTAGLSAAQDIATSVANRKRFADQQIPALACRHNVNYWRGGSFYGLGPSATSYVKGVRGKNYSNTELYCNRIETGQRALESTEQLSDLARAGETAAFGLRMNAGWPFEEFRNVTGYDLRQSWTEEMSELAAQGMGALNVDRFQLTPRGLRFADSAAQLFLK